MNKKLVQYPLKRVNDRFLLDILTRVRGVDRHLLIKNMIKINSAAVERLKKGLPTSRIRMCTAKWYIVKAKTSKYMIAPKKR